MRTLRAGKLIAQTIRLRSSSFLAPLLPDISLPARKNNVNIWHAFHHIGNGNKEPCLMIDGELVPSDIVHLQAGGTLALNVCEGCPKIGRVILRFTLRKETVKTLGQPRKAGP